MRVPMRILITNDDGVHARGLEVLEEIARALSDDIWVVVLVRALALAGFRAREGLGWPLRQSGADRCGCRIRSSRTRGIDTTSARRR